MLWKISAYDRQNAVQHRRARSIVVRCCDGGEPRLDATLLEETNADGDDENEGRDARHAVAGNMTTKTLQQQKRSEIETKGVISVVGARLP